MMRLEVFRNIVKFTNSSCNKHVTCNIQQNVVGVRRETLDVHETRIISYVKLVWAITIN